jgi:hypothetical protein
MTLPVECGNHEENVHEYKAKGYKNRPKTKLGIPIWSNA